MFTKQDYAYKIGCGRLIFEEHALIYLPQEILRLGKNPYLLMGPHAWAAEGNRISETLAESGIDFYCDVWSRPCSEEKAKDIINDCKDHKCDMILGAGGGRIMDLAKLAGNIGNIPVINMPLIAATCAAYTPLSVVYTPSGACRGTWYFKREVESVLCDLSILRREDRRYLNAGALDAMAKWVEINHYKSDGLSMPKDETLARLLAKQLFADLNGTLHETEELGSQTIDDAVFHNIVTTGMISGIARGHYQAALAHGLYYAIRTLFGNEAKPFLHGEIVAVGMLFQEMYLGNTDSKDMLKKLLRSLNMPASLADLSIPVTDDTLYQLASYPSVTELYLQGKEDISKGMMILKSI